MFAVVYLSGKQYRLREKDEIEVEKLDIESGKNFKINEVLLMGEEDGSSLKIGMPFVSGAHVECQILEHGKGEKIRVFKFKAKKRYHRTQGHRQQFTAIKVLKISAVGGKAPAQALKEEVAQVKEVNVSKPKVEKVAKAVVKKTATKKPAVKKTTK